MRKTVCFAFLLAVCFWATNAFAAQGQWGGFIYLIPKTGAQIPSDKKEDILLTLKNDAAGFSNEFDPGKGTLETIHYLKGRGYTLNGKPVTTGVASALIRVESLDRARVDAFHKSVVSALKDYFAVEYRIAVTGQLSYTDAMTLARLKEGAPKRGNAVEQPNAVVFPIAKTPQWWELPTDKRTEYFHKNPEAFGKDHSGHNEVGFVYIKKIFRKLYHSRFIDPQQDFMTYFEFSDDDKPAFESLLQGLRDEKINPEWKYVVEKPLFTGKRVKSIDEIL